MSEEFSSIPLPIPVSIHYFNGGCDGGKGRKSYNSTTKERSKMMIQEKKQDDVH